MLDDHIARALFQALADSWPDDADVQRIAIAQSKPGHVVVTVWTALPGAIIGHRGETAAELRDRLRTAVPQVSVELRVQRAAPPEEAGGLRVQDLLGEQDDIGPASPAELGLRSPDPWAPGAWALDPWAPGPAEPDRWEPDRWEPDRWEPDRWGTGRWETDRWETDRWAPNAQGPDREARDLVPELVGMTVPEAVAKARASGFALTMADPDGAPITARSARAEYERWIVVSQSPVSGVLVPLRSRIVVAIEDRGGGGQSGDREPRVPRPPGGLVHLERVAIDEVA